MENADIHIQQNENGQEVFVFDPYNPLNKEITRGEIQSILRNYGINRPIHKEDLYKRAFIHQSYTRRPDAENAANNVVIAPKPPNCLPLRQLSNETLEFVGDGVLECITKMYLYMRFASHDEGFMTEKKIALVKNEAIGKMALEMGLNRWYIMSRHAEEKQTRNNLKKLGCLFEAFIGAIFLDFNRVPVGDDGGLAAETGLGFQAAQKFVVNVFEKHVDWTKLLMTDDNYKNILQVKIQKNFKVTPHYLELPSAAAAASTAAAAEAQPTYRMGVFLCLGQPIHTVHWTTARMLAEFDSLEEISRQYQESGRIFVFLGEGIHKIKKKAEQMACEAALRQIDGGAVSRG